MTSTKVKTIYTGIDHETLNKDGPEFSAIELFFTEVSRLKEAGVSDLSAELNKSVELKRLKHERALRLATLQTGYEWCRLVREAGWPIGMACCSHFGSSLEKVRTRAKRHALIPVRVGQELS